jgi:pimeloyl-ACP methyl ester carboxylesterase
MPTMKPLWLFFSTVVLFAALPASAQSGARPGWNLPEPQDVQVLGHRIRYYEKGSGPTIVLVHGFSGSAALEWGRVFDLLAARHRVLAPYQIGFAPSEQPDIAYDTAAFVDHLGGFLRALDVRDATLVGESFGGWVVTMYAVRAAEEGAQLPPVGRLVIVDGGLLSLSSAPAPGCGFDPQGCLYDAAARAEVGEYVRAHPFLDNEPTKAKTGEQSGLSRGEPSEDALKRIRLPTLLIWGDQDELVPLAVGRKAKQAIPGARLVVLANVGHIPSLERPVEFARIVAAFAR